MRPLKSHPWTVVPFPSWQPVSVNNSSAGAFIGYSQLTVSPSSSLLQILRCTNPLPPTDHRSYQWTTFLRVEIIDTSEWNLFDLPLFSPCHQIANPSLAWLEFPGTTWTRCSEFPLRSLLDAASWPRSLDSTLVFAIGPSTRAGDDRLNYFFFRVLPRKQVTGSWHLLDF